MVAGVAAVLVVLPAGVAALVVAVAGVAAVLVVLLAGVAALVVTVAGVAAAVALLAGVAKVPGALVASDEADAGAADP